MVKRTGIILLLMAGCGGPQTEPQLQSRPLTKLDGATITKAPFAYTVVKKDDEPFMGEPRYELRLETTNDVAKKATEEDLKQFWKFIRPTVGKGFVRIFLSTPVPGADAWGVILHDKSGGTWHEEFIKRESGVDAEPDCFLPTIDKSKKNQDKMILTLPMANRIVEKLTRRGWRLKKREVDDIEMDRSAGIQSFRITLYPEEIYLTSFAPDSGDMIEWTDTAMLLVNDLGIADELKSNLQSVIGGAAYMRAVGGSPATNEWTIGDYYLEYVHYPGIDDLRINDAATVAKDKAIPKRKKPVTKP